MDGPAAPASCSRCSCSLPDPWSVPDRGPRSGAPPPGAPGSRHTAAGVPDRGRSPLALGRRGAGARLLAELGGLRPEGDARPGGREGRGKSVRILYYHAAPVNLNTVYLHLHQNLHKEGSPRNQPEEVTGGCHDHEPRRRRRRARGGTDRAGPGVGSERERHAGATHDPGRARRHRAARHRMGVHGAPERCGADGALRPRDVLCRVLVPEDGRLRQRPRLEPPSRTSATRSSTTSSATTRPS